MAFVHSKNTRVVANTTALSGYVNSLSAGWSQALGETTTVLDEGNRFIPGLWSGTLTIGGLFDPAAHTALQAAVGVDNGLLVTAGPDGLAVGKPVYIANGDMSGYTIDASVSETVGWSTEAAPDDGPDWGVSLHDLGAETATGNGTSVDNAASSSNGGVGVLHVTAASGTTPTLDAKIQHSVDNSVWVDLITFTQATAATAERLTVSGTVNRYVRAIWTIAGTGPSFTFAAAFARR